ncbi:LysM peptidoglycan-binding domain-containing protein [Paenibacillus sp. MWE-103]|uniref:LysM peptidoglycan-binding domain-containing protein n=1 Tax=Paenibacillus artemisiicola TaxID=1172618 RepID=A0ABS3WA57_9BACL|nr:CAP domain-containing protein [Paenibacillus artemisiicola]MBO7745153.1 LysM peptidoglycan-binding domain-containing protein [Paenibacillus artemisiicola]
MNMQPFRVGVASVLAAGLIALGGAALNKAEAAAPNASVTYKVTSNDTLYQIARQYGIDLKALIGANPSIANPNVIWPGIIVKVPTSGGWYPSTGTGTGTNAGSNSNAGTGSNTGTGTGTNAGTGTTANPSTGTGTSTTDKSQFASQVVTLVNKERANAGLPALKSDALLTKVAMDKAKDMYAKNYFDHNSPTYGSPFDMMRAYGVNYSYAGENIAKGQRTPQEVMTAWMNSAGHKANILGSHYGKIGVAYYNGEWVQEFTN